MDVNPDHLKQELKYRGRFAPSPTGPLHLGSLYTALASFLQAKSCQGEWLLRIDDADGPRVAPGASDSILSTLERYGLAWDGPVVFQSQETQAYRSALMCLEQAGCLYPCICSRKILSALPRSPSGHIVYPATCRFASLVKLQPYALRVVTDNKQIFFNDLIQGSQHWDIGKEFGDFIVFRRDGIFAYHLATVIDDFQAGITEVLRGVDLLDSTPLQIHLQHLLGLPTPNYQHIPIIVDSQGIKLSKQNLARPVDGHDPSPILLSLLRLLGQSPPQALENAPPAEILAWAIPAWDISRLSGTQIAEPQDADR
jgi:glutamyl-Q tRNA(Asp) synthetase